MRAGDRDRTPVRHARRGRVVGMHADDGFIRATRVHDRVAPGHLPPRCEHETRPRAGMGAEPLDQAGRRDLPVATGEHPVAHPAELLGDIDPMGTGREHRGRVEGRAGQEPGEERLVVEVVGIGTGQEIATHVARVTHVPRQRCEHPPDRAALPHGRDHRGRRLQPRPHGRQLRDLQVGPFELARGREHVRRERGQLALRHIDDHERVQPSQRGPHAVRLGKRGDGVATGDDEAADVARLDLVRQRHGRHLPDHPRQLRPTRRPRASRPPADRGPASDRRRPSAKEARVGGSHHG